LESLTIGNYFEDSPYTTFSCLQLLPKLRFIKFLDKCDKNLIDTLVNEMNDSGRQPVIQVIWKDEEKKALFACISRISIVREQK